MDPLCWLWQREMRRRGTVVVLGQTNTPSSLVQLMLEQVDTATLLFDGIASEDAGDAEDMEGMEGTAVGAGGAGCIPQVGDGGTARVGRRPRATRSTDDTHSRTCTTSPSDRLTFPRHPIHPLA
jgi:hypothetical protein